MLTKPWCENFTSRNGGGDIEADVDISVDGGMLIGLSEAQVMRDALCIFKGNMMKIAILLLSFIFSGQANIAAAATPIFQLAPHSASTLHATRDVDNYSGANAQNIERVSFERPASGFPVQSGSLNSVAAPHMVFATLEESHDAWPQTDTTTRNFSRIADGNGISKKMVSSVGVVDDSLYYFLRNFKRQPPQKPALWTIFLVGLCLLMYQIRRRPMRSSIGFFPMSRMMGRVSA